MTTVQSPEIDALRSQLKQLRQHKDGVRQTMAPEFYTSQSFHDFERQELFHKEWICVGNAGEIPEPGDYFTTDIADEPLIIARRKDGTINALSNVCRHRGNMVATGKGNRRSFVCGYHAWSYDLDGALKTAPLMSKVKGFDRASCRLHGFRTEIWSGFIFVNLDGSAAPLGPQLTSLDTILHNYHNEERNLLFTDETEWATNWKNLNENFIEGYHLFATHPKTLEPMTPTQLCRKVPGQEAWTAYRSYYHPDFPPRGPFHVDMTEDEQRNSVMGNIFPCFVFGVAANYTLYLCLRPRGPDKVAIRWGVLGFKTDPADPEVVNYVELCKEFNAEDREKLEVLQQAQKTRYASPGFLGPDNLEGTIWDFLQFMARQLGE
ncbi:Carnitine monooxygenase oxygenase subunit (plasmid) [Pseudoseohaeicola sp. NH-UV-7]|uniref:aromatic ring-hydroxylating oxygenase subunit alpha n=1 Tax=unclassified Sulfitobacter TaxID=196795 RepID=UPI000E0AA58D|nr:aromatic ring-hydroxylating dioxygenase subunit alpha [Sulfitobacter sp. JL08]AXI53357.1 aromatic ring-hydroxylating dioxygenase subunit alpha [Sulfitobacter sp. JL08]